MTPEAYDAWYATPRGRWIGEREFALLAGMLAAKPGETLLDVGTGTGYFARRFARDTGLRVTTIDFAADMIAYAHAKAPELACVRADARALPFADTSFDHVIAVTSLCFVADEVRAVREMARVARRRVALGLLNRRSLLWLLKHGVGSYAGAHWHTEGEGHALLANAGLGDIRTASTVALPGGGGIARTIDPILPSSLPWGSFLAMAGRSERATEGTQ